MAAVARGLGGVPAGDVDGRAHDLGKPRQAQLEWRADGPVLRRARIGALSQKT